MKSRTSSRPQRRLTKLSKDGAASRSSKVDLGHEDDSRPVSELISASYESLTLEDRQRLREQFTTTFPDAVSPEDWTSQPSRWPSRDNLSKFATMGRRERALKAASTLTLEHGSVEPPALSPTLSFYTARPTQTGMPETIDVEAAITLLQELRKKASPEELVALHRALLPVKEIEPVDPYEHDHQLASEYRTQFASKRRSNMPPGLATRGGPEDDPLRRYGDIQRRPVPARKSAVLDGHRPHTPVDSSNGQAGVYRSGTLRITNGCASPVSSMHFTDSYEYQDAKEIKIVHTTVATLDLVKELAVSDESSDESNTIEHGSPQLERTIEERSVSPTITRPQPERTNTAMRHYNEFLTSPYDRKVSGESTSSNIESVDQQFVTPKASIADLLTPEDTPEMPARSAPRPEPVMHVDSGYGSESSNGRLTVAKKSAEKTPVKLRPVEDQRWLTALPRTDDAERHSLYTFDQIVRSPSILGEQAPARALSPLPSKPTIARRQTLFSSLKLRTPSGKHAEASIQTPDSIETVEAEVDKKSKKSKSKKLKKATPHHIKQARKELKRLEIAALADAESRSLPAVETSSREQTPAKGSVQDDFRTKAPRAYARMKAADSAFEQQELQRSRSTSYNDRQLTTAMTDDVDDTSVINFGAVARSLGASPYDISTRQFSETIDYIEGSENKHRIQSPFEIGHGFGLRTQGMDEKAASELARSKSRDYESDRPASGSPRGPRKPVIDREMPPLPPLPFQVNEPQDISEPKVLAQEPIATQRRFPIMDGPVTPVDWEPQARIWRERREAINAKVSPDKEPTIPELQIKVTQHLDSPAPVTPPRKSIKIETVKITHAQAVLADARAAINQRVSSPVSPVGETSRHSWSKPLSPVSDISTPAEEAPVSAPRGPRPPSRVALVEASSGRFSADYLAQLNAATPPEPLRSAPPVPVKERPLSAELSLPDTEKRPSIGARPLSAVLTLDRYSGGFQYEWQRDVGVMGSAGTRTSMKEGSARSKPSKVAYGLDFSDIPLFVEKAQH